jgi:hypothetical protein
MFLFETSDSKHVDLRRQNGNGPEKPKLTKTDIESRRGLISPSSSWTCGLSTISQIWLHCCCPRIPMEEHHEFSPVKDGFETDSTIPSGDQLESAKTPDSQDLESSTERDRRGGLLFRETDVTLETKTYGSAWQHNPDQYWSQINKGRERPGSVPRLPLASLQPTAKGFYTGRYDSDSPVSGSSRTNGSRSSDDLQVLDEGAVLDLPSGSQRLVRAGIADRFMASQKKGTQQDYRSPLPIAPCYDSNSQLGAIDQQKPWEKR